MTEYAWFRNNSGSTKHPVGEKKPNAWGLFDMHGNVWEWCADWKGEYKGDATNPVGAPSGSGRVIRGGGLLSDASYCRSAGRDIIPAYNWYSVGFRLSVPTGQQ